MADLFIIVLFSIIWIACPISYDEMRIRHPIRHVILIS